MRKFSKRLKHFLIAAMTTLLAFLTIQTARADSTDVPYLTNIQNYTNTIMGVINQLPSYLGNLSTLATTLLASDNGGGSPIDWSANWTNQQSWLSTLGSDALSNETNQYALQQTLLTNFFGSSNISAGNPNNINDLSYSTLLGAPLLNPDPRSGVDAATNYLVNASSLGIPLTAPEDGWQGDKTSQKVYKNFYNTITSVQTYNAFVLSRLYEDGKTASNDNSLRKQLITQSSSSSWFTSVISNDLGWVLRQLLLYSSQTYILMDQLLQTQKQAAATLAMTNTLIIANSLIQSNQLLQKAQGSQGQ